MPIKNFLLKLLENINLKKKKFIIEAADEKIQKVLLILSDNKWIHSFNINKIDSHKHPQATIFLNYDSTGKSVVRDIFETDWRKEIVSVESIKPLVKDHSDILYLFETKKGIMSGKECVHYNIGGQLIGLVIS